MEILLTITLILYDCCILSNIIESECGTVPFHIIESERDTILSDCGTLLSNIIYSECGIITIFWTLICLLLT